MKIYEIQWKSSEDKQPAWNQAKVSMRAGVLIPIYQILKHHDTRSTETHIFQKMYEKQVKAM